MSETDPRPLVLIVCTGNVCRSPYIERRLQAELDRSWGADAVQVRSAGTGALTGNPMEPGAQALLQREGGDGSDFVARDLTRDLVAQASLVLTATRSHRTQVTRMFPRALRSTHAFTDLAHLAEGVELPDAAGDLTAAEWMREVAPLLAAQRGLRPPLAADEADIVDPYRRGLEVFEEMADQVEASLPAVVRVLGRPN